MLPNSQEFVQLFHSILPRLLTIFAVLLAILPSPSHAQNVDWMTVDTAQRLDLGFPVLVPSYIPGGFGGQPSVSASGGYYSLYWGPAGSTYVYIEGTVGGSLPAGSPADLNNELFVNANVRGYEAINDMTSIYDAVWWIEGGVLYKVESFGVESSISIANSLVTLVPPAPAPEPTEPPPPPTEVPQEEPDQTEPDDTSSTGGSESTDSGDSTDTTDSADEGDTTDSEDSADTEETVEEEPEGPSQLGLILSAQSQVYSGGSVSILVNGAEASDLLCSDGLFVIEGDCGIVAVEDGSIVWRAPVVEEETEVTIQLLLSQTGDSVDELSITVVPVGEDVTGDQSDGTGGANAPIVGGDGTGGSGEVTIPFGIGTPES